MPSPRKLSADSVRIAVEMLAVAATMIVGAASGTTCRHITSSRRTPM